MKIVIQITVSVIILVIYFVVKNKKNVTDRSSDPYSEILHLWEDDNLMLELLPFENLEFVKSETERIKDFGVEHFDGTGFSDITLIKSCPVLTIEKLIEIKNIERIMTEVGLEKINKFYMQGVGLLEGDKAPLGFGMDKFAIMCNKENEMLENIWVTGHTSTQEEKQKLIEALLLFGQTFNFIAVNWYQGKYYNLRERNSVSDFVQHI